MFCWRKVGGFIGLWFGMDGVVLRGMFGVFIGFGFFMLGNVSFILGVCLFIIFCMCENLGLGFWGCLRFGIFFRGKYCSVWLGFLDGIMRDRSNLGISVVLGRMIFCRFGFVNIEGMLFFRIAKELGVFGFLGL